MRHFLCSMESRILFQRDSRESRDSEGCDSSSSSHHQISPKASSAWDATPSLFDLPSYDSSGLFDVKPQKATQHDAFDPNSLNFLSELLKLNIGGQLQNQVSIQTFFLINDFLVEVAHKFAQRVTESLRLS